MTKPSRSKFDEWTAAEVRRVRAEHPNRPIIIGEFKVPIFCAAVGAVIGAVVWGTATRRDSIVLALPLSVVGCAALGAFAGQLMNLFDHYRARRYHAGKSTFQSRGSFILVVSVAAVIVFVLIAVIACVVLALR